jgi:hypothetical protein
LAFGLEGHCIASRHMYSKFLRLFGGKAFEIPFRFEHITRGPAKIVGDPGMSHFKDDFLSKVHVYHQNIRIAAAEHGLIRRWRTHHNTDSKHQSR